MPPLKHAKRPKRTYDISAGKIGKKRKTNNAVPCANIIRLSLYPY